MASSSSYAEYLRRMHSNPRGALIMRARKQRRLLHWVGWFYQVSLWITLAVIGFSVWNGATISYFSEGQEYLKQIIDRKIPYHQMDIAR